MKKEELSIHQEMHARVADKALLEDAMKYAFQYMDERNVRPVYPTEEALRNLARFDEPLPESPQSGAEILRTLHEYGSPATVAQSGGRYFGFVNGSSVPAAQAARWLSDTWDQNSALYVLSPIAARLEQVCERWLVDLLGLPDETVAGLVGGTSVAILCGLAAARHTIMERLGWDVNANGLFGAPPFRVVVSERAHGTVFKALALLGLGRDRIERIRADDQGRMDRSQLPELDRHTLVILQAGNVDTGSFDHFRDIGERARRAGAWVHIDGAFGLWAAASGRTRHQTDGVELADSWSVDAHKTLNTPYDCGIVLCRHRNALVAAMQASGAYIHYSDDRDGMLYVPDMSRRARSVELWAALKYLGRRGVEELVNGLCDRAVQFAEQLAAERFRVLNDVVFNQVMVACDKPDETTATMNALQQSGECWCGGTTWNGEPAIRISVCSWVTTPADVDRSVRAFVDARRSASA